MKTEGLQIKKRKHPGLMFSFPGNNPSSHVRTINSQDNRTFEEMIIGSMLLLKEEIYSAKSIRTTEREYN